MKRMIQLLIIEILLVLLILPVIPLYAAGVVVDTSTTDSPWSNRYYNSQIFDAAGLTWAFYSSNTTSMVYKTSADRSSWSAATVLDNTTATNINVYASGNTFCYIRGTSTLYFREGTLGADGSITWLQAEQTVDTGLYIPSYRPSVSLDSSGHAYVIGQAVTTGYPILYRNANTDGTWATDAGYPITLKTDTYLCYKLLPLTANKMYVLYFKSGAAHILGKYYNGSSWGGEESISAYAPGSDTRWSAIADGDVVTVAVPKSGANSHAYINTRSAAGAWTEQDVPISPGWWYGMVIAKTNSGNLILIHDTSTDHFYYKMRVDGVWSAEVDWINESTDHLKLTGYEAESQQTNGILSLGYVTKSASPYNVKLEYLQLPTVTTFGNGASPGKLFFFGTLGSVGHDVSGNATCLFQYGTKSGNYTYATAPQTLSGAGSFQDTSTTLEHYSGPVYFRAVAQNGAGSAYGSEIPFESQPRLSAFTGVMPVVYVTPMIILVGIFGSGVFFGLRGLKGIKDGSTDYGGNIIIAAIMLAFSIVGFLTLNIIISAIQNYLAF